MAATPPRRSAAASAAEQDSATPLACLFDRFNSLAVETGATAGKAAAMSTISERAGARMAIGATPAVQFPGLHGGACALPPPASVPRTPLGPARRVAMAPGASAASAAAVARGSSRVRVSFGTPVVHRYDSAPRRERTGAGDAAAGESPMPSTAGHTPYSRSGGRGSMRGGAAAGGRRGARSSGPAGVSPLGAPDFDGACIVEGDEAAAREEEAHVQAQLEVPVAADVASSTPAPGSAGFTFMRPPADQERTPAMKSRQPNSDGATPTLFGTCRGSPGPAHQPAGSADVVVPAAAFPPFTSAYWLGDKGGDADYRYCCSLPGKIVFSARTLWEQNFQQAHSQTPFLPSSLHRCRSQRRRRLPSRRCASPRASPASCPGAHPPRPISINAWYCA